MPRRMSKEVERSGRRCQDLKRFSQESRVTLGGLLNRNRCGGSQPSERLDADDNLVPFRPPIPGADDLPPGDNNGLDDSAGNNAPQAILSVKQRASVRVAENHFVKGWKKPH